MKTKLNQIDIEKQAKEWVDNEYGDGELVLQKCYIAGANWAIKTKYEETYKAVFDLPCDTRSDKMIIDENKSNKLFQCPYFTATKCNLKHCCLECEKFAEYYNSLINKL